MVAAQPSTGLAFKPEIGTLLKIEHICFSMEAEKLSSIGIGLSV